MNPSSSGWIAKQLVLLKKTDFPENEIDHYKQLRKTGFVYGVSVALITPQPHFIHPWTIEEKTKVNLLDALSYAYRSQHDNLDHFSTTTSVFYNILLEGKSYKTGKIREERKAQNSLEKIIHTRLKTSESPLKKNFSAMLTNALLYIDVLAFKHYCTINATPRHYAVNLEFLILQVICIAVQQKQKKSERDRLLLDLFEKSLRYHKNRIPSSQKLDSLNFENRTIEERQYLLDLSSLLFWDDLNWLEIDGHFMVRLAGQLQLSEAKLVETQESISFFTQNHKAAMPYFNPAHPLRHFYDQTSVMVRTLVLRNKTRLLKEIVESKDLVLLLGKSTYKELSKEERKMVKSQLLDICKGVPSLAIFLLPGGSVLLPLLIRYIPELLPSAFDENRIEDNPVED